MQAIAAGSAPGAVVLVGRGSGTLLCEAFGRRSVEPTPEPMATDAVFDLASLTKPVATATSILRLIAAGRLRLDDAVARHLPDFRGNGKESITIEQLLRHRGGLLPDNALRDYMDGPALARQRIFDLGLEASPGTRFIYTDVGFIVLGWVVEAVSGVRLHEFAAGEIFRPLGMSDTRFLPLDGSPDPSYLARIAPTERGESGRPLEGVVHDPRARLLGGVAGHAGLFSTAGDLARFARMILAEGRLPDGSVFLPSDLVRAAGDSGGLPPGERRGLGFDLDTRYSSPAGGHLRGDGLGHTGFTGTSLWMHRGSGLFVILLTSRLHPDGRGDVQALRRSVADAAARAVGF